MDIYRGRWSPLQIFEIITVNQGCVILTVDVNRVTGINLSLNCSKRWLTGRPGHGCSQSPFVNLPAAAGAMTPSRSTQPSALIVTQVGFRTGICPKKEFV